LADLPPAARAYLDRLETLVGVPVRYVSVGTRRDQIIEV
jgi:adenylosuccinate synthase